MGCGLRCLHPNGVFAVDGPKGWGWKVTDNGAKRPVLIGLTGGIGSGKSTVAAMFADHGIPVVDADELARAVVEPGQPAHADIADAWPMVVDPAGRIDRRALGALVFADAGARMRLESFTHPRIRQALNNRVSELQAAGHEMVVYEASLLVEAGQLRDFPVLVVVTAPKAVQIARAVARGQQNEADVRARMAAQMPLAEKVKVATHVIDNQGTLAETRRQVDALVDELRIRFAGTP